ncbi:MAG: peptide chain release factor-like protein [Verrucomicrobiales bacterium]|nr:peptide chain release factor-like protein [Verrucomicrobiales bacterium]
MAAETEQGKAGAEALESRLRALGVDPAQVEEIFVRSGGHGGQNVNKTSTCVQLVHRPTGLVVKCQETRQQGRNRERAWWLLVERLEAARDRRRAEVVAQAEKERRRKRPRSRASKGRMLEGKARQGAKKVLRRRPGDD